VKPNGFYAPLGAILGATMPLWMALPVAGYLLEIALAITLIMAAIEGRLWLVLGAAVVGLALAALPAIGPAPMVLFLPMWLKAVLGPVVLGLLMRAGRVALLSYMAGALVTAAAVLLFYWQGAAVLNEMMNGLGKMLTTMLDTNMKTQGYNAETITDVLDKVTGGIALLKRLLPGILILSGLGQLFVGFVVVDLYYTRRDRYFPGFGPFAYWKMPEWLVYFLGLILAVRLTMHGPGLAVVDNVLLILALAYAVCGLALMEHLLRRLQMPRFVKIVFYVGLLLMQIPGLIIMALVGLFDSYFDFRKVRAHTLG
jgi:hypothetical protein